MDGVLKVASFVLAPCNDVMSCSTLGARGGRCVCFQGDYPWATETNWDDLNRDKKGGVFCIFASLEMWDFFSSFFSLIADGPHHYHPACGH